jgi:hypothetical protein
MASYYYSGQGTLYVAERDGTTGAPLGFTSIGNVPNLEISVEITKYEHKESMSGNRAVDLTIIQEKKGTFTMTMEDMNPNNLAMVFWGATTAVTAGTVATAEEVVAYVGKSTPMAHVAVSTVVVKDDADTITYEFGTSLDDVDSLNGWVDEGSGTVHVFTTAVQTANGAAANIADEDVLHVTYAYAAATEIDGFTVTSMERWMRFIGLNTIDGKTVVIDMFKCQLDPLKGYGLINEELASIEVTGSLLYDDKQTGTSKFFKQVNVT